MSDYYGTAPAGRRIEYHDELPEDCPCIDPDHCEVAGGCLLKDLGLDEEDE